MWVHMLLVDRAVSMFMKLDFFCASTMKVNWLVSMKETLTVAHRC